MHQNSDVNKTTMSTAELLQELHARGLEGHYRPKAAPGYEALFVTLLEAHDQAAIGKGRDRHAKGQPFLKQPIMEIGRMVGPGYQTGQSMKKAQEAMGMLGRREYGKAMAELLGAINYLAAAYLLIEEQQEAAITLNQTEGSN